VTHPARRVNGADDSADLVGLRLDADGRAVLSHCVVGVDLPSRQQLGVGVNVGVAVQAGLLLDDVLHVT
jgi:hypothetical protein